MNVSDNVDSNSSSIIKLNFAGSNNGLFAVLSGLYVVGILGSFLAIVHLYQKQNFRNTKQAFMLKCLVTSDFVGLTGSGLSMVMVGRMEYFYNDNIWFFCFLRILWRFFGLSSGCVAFIMAIERYYALTKPFMYCKYFTNGLIKRLVLMSWIFAFVLTLAPVFGFGLYYNARDKKCERYRGADDPLDVAYAFIFFLVGSFLCFAMIVSTLSVTRIVYRSYRNMQLTLNSCLENMDREQQQTLKFRHQGSEVSSTGSTTSKSISIVTRDEIAFINMVNLLTLSFVLCWGTQMITIPIAQFVDDANQKDWIATFYKIADFLLLLHFTFDPFIYVLFRTNYWLRFKRFLRMHFATQQQQQDLRQP